MNPTQIEALVGEIVNGLVIAHVKCPGCGWVTYVRRSLTDGTENWDQAAEWIRTHERTRHQT